MSTGPIQSWWHQRPRPAEALSDRSIAPGDQHALSTDSTWRRWAWQRLMKSRMWVRCTYGATLGAADCSRSANHVLHPEPIIPTAKRADLRSLGRVERIDLAQANLEVQPVLVRARAEVAQVGRIQS